MKRSTEGCAGIALAGLWGLLSCMAASAQDKPANSGVDAAATGQATSPDPKPSPRPASSPSQQDTRLSEAAAQRNENIQVNQIDNDAVKEVNIRLGSNLTVFPQVPVEAGAYASEYGRALSLPPVPSRSDSPSRFHAEIYELFQNSVFNARTFFQVGPVKPSHQNSYGARMTTGIPRLGDVTFGFSQHKERGMVNGNVLVPLPSERTPLAADPAACAMITRILSAFPAQFPNRPDMDPRLLNRNTPQIIDSIEGDLAIRRDLGERNQLVLSETLMRRRIDAFQLVAGQNPDTEIHNHNARLGLTHQFSPATTMRAGVAFQRVMSDLRSDPTAVGPYVQSANDIADLGPDQQFPLHRALNTYSWGVVFGSRPGNGRHQLTWGVDGSRYQMNGTESANVRGLYKFNSAQGNTATQNLLLGLPSLYEVTLGPMSRGFRNLEANFFLADQWNTTARVQIYYGLRYNQATTPTEVNGLNALPYPCDCNNFSPRLAIAYRLPGQWVLRTGYTVSFGQIYPVTYSQVRFNAPLAARIQVQGPDLVNPLGGLDLKGPNIRQSPTYFSPDLVSPYTHQYTFNLERRFGPDTASYFIRLSYLGSRTFKLLDMNWTNRAVQVPGIPLTTATVDQRRPDARYSDVRWVVNSGAAYLDAAQVYFTAPSHRGLSVYLTYTFGKALDTGADYSGTAANNDALKYRAQADSASLRDRKGYSNFDSTHSLVFYYSYDVTRNLIPRRFRRLLGGWQLSGATLIRTGTPFIITTGSDGPGYGNVDGVTGERPNLLDPSILGMTIGDPDTSQSILRKDRFSFLAPGQMTGSLARNAFRKGGIMNWNAAVSKLFRLGRRREPTIAFRAEAINLMNHPQFDAPQPTLTNPSFGRITNTLNNGRVLQFGVTLRI